MVTVLLGVVAACLMANGVTDSFGLSMNRVMNGAKALSLLTRRLFIDAQVESSMRWFGVLTEERKAKIHKGLKRNAHISDTAVRVMVLMSKA